MSLNYIQLANKALQDECTMMTIGQLLNSTAGLDLYCHETIDDMEDESGNDDEGTVMMKNDHLNVPSTSLKSIHKSESDYQSSEVESDDEGAVTMKNDHLNVPSKNLKRSHSLESDDQSSEASKEKLFRPTNSMSESQGEIEPFEEQPTPIDIIKVEKDLIQEYYDFAYFIDINFLLAKDMPNSLASMDSSGPLAMSNLRPKEVSLIRISGAPNLRHWHINYARFEGRPDFSRNQYISSIVHGLAWKTKDDEAYDFERFSILLTRAVYNAKLYTTNSLVYHYLTEIFNFKGVVKLEKRKIQFDSYIHECEHHTWTSHTLRCCTTNRVWAMRHCYSEELSSIP